MATAAAFNLSVPHDDTMDVSSPAQREHEDIDIIDFDEPLDDEQMIEDAEMRPGTATDAEMDDDLNRESAFVQEEEMPDQVERQQLVVEDDELIDYDDDDDYQDPPQPEQAAPQSVPTELVPPAQPTAPGNDAAYETQDEPQLPVEASSAQVSFEGDTQQVENVASESAEQANEDALSLASDIPNFTQVSGHEEENDHHHHEQESDAQHADPVETEKPLEEIESAHADPDQPAASLVTDVAAVHDAPPTPTDTGLHPVNLHYDGLDMPLFKSKSHPGGLLTDDNLANLSLADLMQNCRDRLTLSGEDISADKEILLSFDGLPMMLYESSRSAFDCSLNDVLETYLQLHRNEDISEIPPMSLTLSFQMKFKNTLDFFKQMAEAGHGISNVPRLPQQPREDYGEEYAEETGFDQEEYSNQYETYEEGPAEEDDEHHGDGHGGQGPQDEGTGQDYHEAAGQEFHGEEYHGESAEYDEAEYPQHEYAEQPFDGQQYEESGEEYDQDAANAHGAEGEAFEDYTNEEAGENDLEPPNGTGNDPSPSSSDTVHGDANQNAANAACPDTGHGESTKSLEGAKAGDYAGHEQLEAYEVLDGDDDDANKATAPLEDGQDEFHTAYDFQAEVDNGTHEPEQDATKPKQATQIAAEDELLEYDDDDEAPADAAADDLIDFDDDTTEQHEARQRASLSKPSGGNSPLGKRSFEEAADDEDVLNFDDEPEPKKVRSE